MDKRTKMKRAKILSKSLDSLIAKSAKNMKVSEEKVWEAVLSCAVISKVYLNLPELDDIQEECDFGDKLIEEIEAIIERKVKLLRKRK